MEHFLFWKTVNVVILIALLYWLLKKPVSRFVADGINAIVTKFEKAKEEKEEVEEEVEEEEEI